MAHSARRGIGKGLTLSPTPRGRTREEAGRIAVCRCPCPVRSECERSRRRAAPAQTRSRQPTSVGFGGAVSSVDADATKHRARRTAPWWQRGRRRGRHGRRPRGDRAVLRRRRRWRVLRLLQRQEPQGVHDRRPRDRTRDDAVRRVHEQGDRSAVPLRATGDLWRVDRRTGHAGDLGQRAAAVGFAVARQGAAAGRRPGRSRLRGRLDVPPPDAREQGPVRAGRADGEAVPAQRRRAAGRIGVQEPGARRHLPPDRQAGPVGVLPRSAGRRDGRRGRRTRRRPPTPRCRSSPGYLDDRRPGEVQGDRPPPTKVRYDGLDVYGMPPSSSGGTTVGEALNILQPQHLAQQSTTQALHTYLEASALAFADRGAYVGDPAYVDVPQKELLSRGLRRRAVVPDRPGSKAAVKPVPAGSPDGKYSPCATGTAAEQRPDTEGPFDHAPGHRGQVGQRRLLHADDRADRRQRHHGSRTRVPAEQRADRLLRGP